MTPPTHTHALGEPRHGLQNAEFRRPSGLQFPITILEIRAWLSQGSSHEPSFTPKPSSRATGRLDFSVSIFGQSLFPFRVKLVS